MDNIYKHQDEFVFYIQKIGINKPKYKQYTNIHKQQYKYISLFYYTSWVDVWVEPFFAVFEKGDCAPTIEGLLPGLLRLRPTLANEILTRSSTQRSYLLLALKALSPEQLFERPENLQRAQWATDERFFFISSIIRQITLQNLEYVEIICNHSHS